MSWELLVPKNKVLVPPIVYPFRQRCKFALFMMKKKKEEKKKERREKFGAVKNEFYVQYRKWAPRKFSHASGRLDQSKQGWPQRGKKAGHVPEARAIAAFPFNRRYLPTNTEKLPQLS